MPTDHKKKTSPGPLLSSLCLLGAALLWGMTFVAQSIAAEQLSPYTYNASRFLLGFLVLLPFAFRKKKHPAPAGAATASCGRTLLTGGFFCGLCIFLAGAFQQVGIQYTTAGKSGFITALYIVLVPLLGLFLKRKASPLILPAVLLAMTGFYFLCITETFSINKGDAITLGCSLVFAFHILTVDFFSPRTDPVRLSCVQFFFASLFSWIVAFIAESPQLSPILACWKPIAFAGIFSCGIAYTLQIIGQRGLHPAAAALLMSLESVFSVLAGWLILGDRLQPREALGCILVFAAVLLAQLPFPQKKGAVNGSL